MARPVHRAGLTMVEYWEALATLPAQRLEGYGYTAATTQDSMLSGNPFTAFFISALTNNIDVFYSSNVDSAAAIRSTICRPSAPRTSPPRPWGIRPSACSGTPTRKPIS
jgi:hypothetical protein